MTSAASKPSIPGAVGRRLHAPLLWTCSRAGAGLRPNRLSPPRRTAAGRSGVLFRRDALVTALLISTPCVVVPGCHHQWERRDARAHRGMAIPHRLAERCRRASRVPDRGGARPPAGVPTARMDRCPESTIAVASWPPEPHRRGRAAHGRRVDSSRMAPICCSGARCPNCSASSRTGSTRATSCGRGPAVTATVHASRSTTCRVGRISSTARSQPWSICRSRRRRA